MIRPTDNIKTVPSGQRGPLTPLEREFFYFLCRWYNGLESEKMDDRRFRERRLFPLIEKNGCAGILFKYVEGGFAPSFQDYDLYRDHYLGICLSNAVYRSASVHLDEACRAQSIPYVLIKGAALLTTIYPEQGIRPLSDIDLIVGSRDDAVRLVEALGLRLSAGHGETFAQRYGEYDKIALPYVLEEERARANIEIHFPVIDSPYSISEFIGLAGPAFLKEPPVRGGVRIIDPTHHLVFLLLHLISQHLGGKLIWHLDIARLIEAHRRDIDWDRVAELSIQMGYRSAFSIMLSAIGDRMGVVIPERILARLKVDPIRNRGILQEMASPQNVLEDSLGVRGLSESGSLGFHKIRPILAFVFFSSLFLDQPKNIVLFILFNSRGRSLGELMFISLAKYRFIGRLSLLKRVLGRAGLILSAIFVLPVHQVLNWKWSKRKNR